MEWTPRDAEQIAHIRWSRHATERMVDGRMTPDMIFEAIARPDQTWEQKKFNRHGKPYIEHVYVKGDIMVVIDKGNLTIMTVLLRSTHRYIRGVHNLDNMPQPDGKAETSTKT